MVGSRAFEGGIGEGGIGMVPLETWRIEPGLFDVWLAPHAQGGAKATFQLIGPASITDGR